MRSFINTIPVIAVVLMIFALPVLADNGAVGQAERVETVNSAAFVCFPFQCK